MRVAGKEIDKAVIFYEAFMKESKFFSIPKGEDISILEHNKTKTTERLPF